MSTLKRRDGMAPSAWNAYLAASERANIDLDEHEKLRVTQAIGTAAASKGFHARDGYVTVNGQKIAYCAATDFSVRWLTLDEIRAWVENLAWFGYAAWYRYGASWAGNTHIHAVYAGLPMKEPLERQVVDYLNDRTGLVGHKKEKFYVGNKEQDAYIRALFDWSNHGGPKPPAPPKSPAPAKAPSLKIKSGYELVLGKSKRVLTLMPAIDGTAWCPVRNWYLWLGIKPEDVSWNPVDQKVYVQGKKLDADLRIMTIDGKRAGYAPIRELAARSGLKVNLVADRRIEITR